MEDPADPRNTGGHHRGGNNMRKLLRVVLEKRKCNSKSDGGSQDLTNFSADYPLMRPMCQNRHENEKINKSINSIS